MATQVTPYEFVPDIRRRAEELRMANVRQAVRGSIRAHSITADMMEVGVLNVGSGAVTIDNGAITGDKLAVNTVTANEIDVGAVGSSELGDDSVTGVKIVNGSVTAAELNVGTLSAITANMGTLTAGSIIGGTIQSGTGTPNAMFSSDGIVLTNAPTSEAVNHAPSHVDFYSDSSADSEQKGTLACFVGSSGADYAPHFTLRALCPSGSPLGRVSIAAWRAGTELASMSVYATGAIQFDWPAGGKVATPAAPNAAGDLNGTWLDGDLTAIQFHSASDRKLKQKIVKLSGGLDTVKALSPVAFEWKRNGRRAIGFVAQDVERVLPDAVVDTSAGIDPKTGEPKGTVKTVNQTALLTHAISALQDVIGRVEALERK